MVYKLIVAKEYKSGTQESVDLAREALADLFKQREELEIRIAKAQRRLAALVTLIDESEESDKLLDLNLGGLTDAIRSALRAAGQRGLTPSEITLRLRQLYFPVGEYKNFRASLTTVLKRLVASGEVRVGIQDLHEGRDQSVYQWVGAIRNKFEGR